MTPPKPSPRQPRLSAATRRTLGELAVPLAVLAIVVALITPLPASFWTC